MGYWEGGLVILGALGKPQLHPLLLAPLLSHPFSSEIKTKPPNAVAVPQIQRPTPPNSVTKASQNSVATPQNAVATPTFGSQEFNLFYFYLGLCSAAGEGRALPVGSEPTAMKDKQRSLTGSEAPG